MIDETRLLEETRKNIFTIEPLKLVIRKTENYLAEIEGVFKDKMGMEYYPQFSMETEMGIEAYINMLEEKGVYIYPIIFKEANELVGIITFSDVDEYCKRIKAGYIFHSNHWSRGFEYEVFRDVAECLRKHKWHRVEASAYSGDKVSQIIYEKCGLTLEGKLRDRQLINGKYHDELIYSTVPSREGMNAPYYSAHRDFF